MPNIGGRARPTVQPSGDRYIDDFASGELDPETTILDDATRPLVFYGLNTDHTLKAVKTLSGEIRIVF